MFSALYHSIIYQPLYNGLIFLMDLIPWADAGIAVVVFTLIVRFVLYPLSRKAVLTQQRIKQFDQDIQKIKEQYKKDRQEQAKKIMAFYKEKGINPFSSFFLIIIQLPIILALYRVFLYSGLPDIKTEILYSFVSVPHKVDMVFLGLVDISSKSFVLAILVGVATFIQMRLSMPNFKPKKAFGASLKDDLARSMSIQMKYVFPVLAIFISYSLSGAIALYWLTSNLFTIGQEIFVKRARNNKQEADVKT